MGIVGWTVDEDGTRDLIRTASGHLENLPQCGQDMTTYFSDAAIASDHVGIGVALDEVLSTFTGPLIDSAHSAGNHVLAQLELAVQAYLDSDRTMGEDAMAAMDAVPTGEDGGDGE